MTDVEYSPNPDVNQYDFIHFVTRNECEIHLLNNRHIQVAYTCCEGRGIALFRENTIYTLSSVDINPFIPIQGTCDICFADDTPLYNTCSSCSQPFCKPCLAKITNKVCPYCRGKLKNNF
jgi:hypothetical protein